MKNLIILELFTSSLIDLTVRRFARFCRRLAFLDGSKKSENMKIELNVANFLFIEIYDNKINYQHIKFPHNYWDFKFPTLTSDLFKTSLWIRLSTLSPRVSLESMFWSSQFITTLDSFAVLLQYCSAFAAVQFSNHAVNIQILSGTLVLFNRIHCR